MTDMKVIKRSGEEVDFDSSKIKNAILGANKEVESNLRLNEETINKIVEHIVKQCELITHIPQIEEIQDMVEKNLVLSNAYDVAKRYILYRYEHAKLRNNQMSEFDKKIFSLVACKNENINEENANKNPHIIPTQRDYMAGEISKYLVRKYVLDNDIVDAHDKGIIHFHDMDYFIQHSHNCCLVNLEDMLQNGTVISTVKIEKPHKFSTACTIATQIIAQVASSQYGGQTISMAHLSPFIDATRQKFKREFAYLKDTLTERQFHDHIEHLVKLDVEEGVQTIQYQLITISTTNGQAPFVTLFLNHGEIPESNTQGREDLDMAIKEVFKQRILGVKNEKGVYVTTAFPKLIYCLDEYNIHPDSEYYSTFQLACECTSKRMVPDYVSAKKMRELKVPEGSTIGDIYPPMGCRSFLTPHKDHKYYGRFNMGVVSINLADIALSSKRDMKEFWAIFDERLQLCKRALLTRYENLKGTPSDVAPILWQYGALARLKSGETIDKLLTDNNATISLGYAGLYECVKYMIGESHTQVIGREFGLKVMQHLNDACAKWKAEYNISFSVYGTPIESTTYKFAKCLQQRFGIIEGITDRNYITNSYHVPVFEKIDAFSKLSKEAEFQALSPGGAISYVEIPNLSKNLQVVEDLARHIYENIVYAELNCKFDYCHVCEYEGEMIMKQNASKKLVWTCPQCGNTDFDKMNIARRVCGYITTYTSNQGRMQEINERVLHL